MWPNMTNQQIRRSAEKNDACCWWQNELVEWGNSWAPRQSSINQPSHSETRPFIGLEYNSFLENPAILSMWELNNKNNNKNNNNNNSDNNYYICYIYILIIRFISPQSSSDCQEWAADHLGSGLGQSWPWLVSGLAMARWNGMDDENPLQLWSFTSYKY